MFFYMIFQIEIALLAKIIEFNSKVMDGHNLMSKV